MLKYEPRALISDHWAVAQQAAELKPLDASVALPTRVQAGGGSSFAYGRVYVSAIRLRRLHDACSSKISA